jgi:hypothetical protein
MKPAHDPAASIEKDLSRRVLDCEPNAMEAAVVLFERAEPATLAEAVGLVGAYGELTPEALDRITQAYDRYWHLRDMPCS